MAYMSRVLGKISSIVSQKAKNIAFRNYSVAKLYFRTIAHITSKKEPLLVYSMGKVGTSTVVHSLRDAGVCYTIYHLHWLVPENLREDEKIYRSAARRHRGTRLEPKFLPLYIWQGQYLRKQIQKRFRDHTKWKVITLIRDPVARNISAFFENIELFFGYDYRSELKFKSEKKVIQELVELFHSSYLTGTDALPIDCNPLTWFDNELKSVFKIDVFDSNFPVEKGFKIYDNAYANVLLIRLEDLDRCASAAFNRFLGLKGIKILPRYLGSEKAYADIYRKFLDRIIIPPSYLEKVYQSKICRHFYTDVELSEFRSRWNG